MQVTNKANSVR